MGSIKKCFVCKEPVPPDSYELNMAINMPVCANCKGTDRENNMVEELLDSLADGLVCGCI